MCSFDDANNISSDIQNPIALYYMCGPLFLSSLHPYSNQQQQQWKDAWPALVSKRLLGGVGKKHSTLINMIKYVAYLCLLVPVIPVGWIPTLQEKKKGGVTKSASTGFRTSKTSTRQPYGKLPAKEPYHPNTTKSPLFRDFQAFGYTDDSRYIAISRFLAPTGNFRGHDIYKTQQQGG